MHRVQGLGVSCIQRAGFRGALQSAEFRRAPHTSAGLVVHSVQPHLNPPKAFSHLYSLLPGPVLVTSLCRRVCLTLQGDLSLSLSIDRSIDLALPWYLLHPGATESKAVPCKHKMLLCLQVTAGAEGKRWRNGVPPHSGRTTGWACQILPMGLVFDMCCRIIPFTVWLAFSITLGVGCRNLDNPDLKL